MRYAGRAADIGRDAEDSCRARDDALELGVVVELQPLHDAEAVAERRGQQSRARRRADQRERLQVELDRARGRSLADHDVELEVFHRRIEDLLDDRAQAMDLVDEQHVVRLQVRQQRRQVAGALDHRSGRLPQAHAQLVRDDVRERGLAETRRAEDQHVIERLASVARGLDEDLHLRLDGRLADVVRKLLRAHGAVERGFVALCVCRYDAVLLDHFTAAACNALRISSSVVCTDASTAFNRRVTSAGL